MYETATLNYKEKLIKKYMFMSNVRSLEFILKATYMQNLIKIKLHWLHIYLSNMKKKIKAGKTYCFILENLQSAPNGLDGF